MKILVSIAATLLSTAICSVAVAQESTKGDVEEALALLEAKGDIVCSGSASASLMNGVSIDDFDFPRQAKPIHIDFQERVSRDTVTMVRVLEQSTIFFSELTDSANQEDYSYGWLNLKDQTYTFSSVTLLKNGERHSLTQYHYRCLFLDEKPN